MPTLSLAEMADAREIAEMSRDWIEQGLDWSWRRLRVQRFIADRNSSVVVARRDSVLDGMSRRIAAFAIMQFADDSAHLNLLAVAPAFRRQGLGRRLIEWLMATAVEAGVFRINVELRAGNENARALYEALGFDRQGLVQGYYQGRETALRMSWRLAKNPC